MITLDQVSKSFGRVPVLDGVSLEIPAGGRVALVGSNGAGKTTLIRCLLGEYTCQGTVAIDGMDPRRWRGDVLRLVGFVPQHPPPLKMPVGELLHFSAAVAGASTQRMAGIAGELGLDVDAVNRQPFVKLSGGQKQKLLIGIALGRDSRVLIMDEPAANLDPASRRVFFRLLAEKGDGPVMLISSHRLDEVAALVNRVVELDTGRVVLDDHVEDAVDLTGGLACTLSLARPEDALAKSLAHWGFRDLEGGIRWEGWIAGPDRLRFLGVLSRYAGLLKGIAMNEEERR